MSNHKKVYCKAFRFYPGDFIPCEVCGVTAVDIHHIQARGMGGSKLRDNPSNLIALCRNCHNRAELITQPTISKDELREIHGVLCDAHGV